MMKCADAKALIAADADGELDRWQAHLLRRHRAGCPACAAESEALRALRGRIASEVPRYATPPAFRDALRARFGEGGSRAKTSSRVFDARWRWLAGGAAAGCAATVLAWVVGTAVLDWRAREDLAAEAVTMHVRATLGNHLVQVASSDQHTVKPWLSARLDYSPTVRDFAGAGFPLIGGRIDYLDGRPVATLVYKLRDHTIDVFVRPLTGGAATPPRNLRGFNVVRTTGDGMEWLIVSDAAVDALSDLAGRLTEGTAAR
jgi:anti-sigma factor RsiW